MANQSEIVLLPNIGAEERHRSEQVLTQHPVVIHLGELWKMCLEPSATSQQDPGQANSLIHWNGLPQSSGLMPWIATESTLLEAQQRGLTHLGPSPEAVQRVHNKGFAAKLAQSIAHTTGWEHSHVIEKNLSEKEAQNLLEEVISAWPHWAQENFTIKPSMGSSGRGRIAGKNGRIDTQHIRGLMKMSQRGGAIIEPWYFTIRNLSTQMLFTSQQTYRILGHTSQILTRAGTYLGNHGLLSSGGCSSGTHFDTELERIAHLVAPLIQKAGFEGVCGFDAFSFTCPESGSTKLRAPLEVNARFTSATVGLSCLKKLATEESLETGSWLFILDAEESWCTAARQNEKWKSFVFQTPTTGKKALVAISEEPTAFQDWLLENKMRP